MQPSQPPRPIAECEICGKLPDSLVVNTGREETFPDTVRKLVALKPDRNSYPSPNYDIRRCPACGALFEWEDRPQFYGSGNLDEEELTRLPDAHAELVRPLLSVAAGSEPGARVLEQAFETLPYRVLRAVVEFRSSFEDVAFKLTPTLVDRIIRTDDHDCAALLSSGSTFADRAAHILELLNADPRPKGTSARQLAERCAKILSKEELPVPREPDAAFIERAVKLYDSIISATAGEVEQLLSDARPYGESSVEMAYALAAQGWMACWSQKNLEKGARDLERAVALAESHGLRAGLIARWLRTNCVLWDDFGEAQKAIDAAQKGHALIAPLEGQVHAETFASSAGFVHTMRLALHPVLPELEALAKVWPSMSEGERKVQLIAVKRFAHRRKDLTPAEIDMLTKVTAEPQGVRAVLPPLEPEADKTELAKVMAELDTLVGLREVKAELKRLAAVLQVEEMRRAAKLAVASRANHFVFLGPPGTGKTTVARLLGRLFKSLGILAKGHVVEVDRSGLVAGYVGQTAIKVAQAVDAALDGVLFVDEAYALFSPSGNDFGHEAVATLLKRMEDDRARLVVVLAGYDEPMLQMLQMNPGLKSRVSTTLHFRTYGASELASIFLAQAGHAGYVLTKEARSRVGEICALMRGSEDPATFGNAREMRNLFEDSIAKQAGRLVVQGKQPTPEQLQSLEAEDIHWDLLGDESLRDTLTGESLRTVAVHELGHALVGHHVDGPPPVMVSTIPSSHALGRAFFGEEQSPIYTRAQLVGRAARALAGRAAEEVVFGVLTSGAAHDLQVAERIALELLRTGMSEETTHAALAEYADTVDGTRSGGLRSARTRQEVGELLQEAYALAIQLVRNHEPALRRAVERLVERRTLSREELGTLFGPRAGGAS